MRHLRLLIALLSVCSVVLVWSATGPSDRFTWFMEVFPFLLAVPILAYTARSFPLTPLTYFLIAFHSIVLMVGGRYTYAEVPLGHWVAQALDLGRNHYDRFGHFVQGFVPAMIAREILRRKTPLVPGKMLFFLVTCICLAISACYEFLEWWTALISGEGAEAFLGTQGDVWDTQWDMFLAMCGAVASQLLLSRLQERQLAELSRNYKK